MHEQSPPSPQMHVRTTRQASHQSISISTTPPTGSKTGSRPRTWTSSPTFSQVFPESARNRDVYEKVVAPNVHRVVQGGTCNVLAYGHSGSGKTHTIVGYQSSEERGGEEEEEDKGRREEQGKGVGETGVCLAAGKALFEALERLGGAGEDTQGELGVAVTLFEVRGKAAVDVLGGGGECHIREGADGQTHVRGPTEVLEEGRVRVRPVAAVACWTYAELQEVVLRGLRARQTGASSVHDQSSRTHAVLELEVVDRGLLEARAAVYEREAELVPVGKRATDIYLEEHMLAMVLTDDGAYVERAERPLDRARIDTAEAEKQVFETRLRNAREAVERYLASTQDRGAYLAGKFVFVDLAGAEYFQSSTGASSRPSQTPLEQRQGVQINKDLFALKQVIRARALNHPHVPFRASPLTMVLRSHFLSPGCQSAMILTVSAASADFAATLNTLMYGDMVDRGKEV